MASLKPIIRVVLNRKEYRDSIQKYLRGEIEWGHRSLSDVKKLTRDILREEQNEICPYCQRIIVVERRNTLEDIEHFLDKSRDYYRRHAFTATNLILSCHSCNMEKGTRDLGDSSIRAARYLYPGLGRFRWPHPYYDDIAACVRKEPGPVYIVVDGSGREVEAENMIKDLKLNHLRNIESRHQVLTQRSRKITSILARFITSDRESCKRRLKFLIEVQEEIHKELY